MRFSTDGRSQVLMAFLIPLFIFFSTNSVLAHTKLISSSPAVASEIDSWPNQIVLEFDDDLINLDTEKSNFVVANNALGDQISEPDEAISGNSISVTLSPNKIKGPVLVYYRVISTDGHPVEGEYKFTYGVGEVTAEGVTDSEAKKYPITIYLASALFIVSGLFFSIYSYRRQNRG